MIKNGKNKYCNGTHGTEMEKKAKVTTEQLSFS
jgi:hypothetical protein